MIQSEKALIVCADDDACHDAGSRHDHKQDQCLNKDILAFGRVHEQNEHHRQRDEIRQTKTLPNSAGNGRASERLHLRSSMVIGPSRRPCVNLSLIHI